MVDLFLKLFRNSVLRFIKSIYAHENGELNKNKKIILNGVFKIILKLF